MKKLKLWWKWRRAKRRHYPFRYIGPTQTLRGLKMEYGTPLKPAKWQRGAVGPARPYEAPDGIIRLLPEKQVEVR